MAAPAGRRKLNIVVEGCCHGELPAIYASVLKMEQIKGIKVDLLICCGDFQCLRNTKDFDGLACPDKYKHLGTFHKYYSGELVAPVLTIFIGGNHEASSYLQELHYGGWVAPKIYFLGFAGVIRVGGVRIAGMTGIFNRRQGRHERPPYNRDTLRSVYYVRELEVFKLAQLTGHLDLFLSHDWPRGIVRYGDASYLFRKKPFFKKEVEDNTLGSAAAEQLLHKVQPDYWFAAHLHVKFPAVVRHGSPRDGQGREGSEVKGVTRFLSLDKCLPDRDFLQLVSVPRPNGQEQGPGVVGGGEGDEVLLEYDVEWLSIVQKSHYLLSNSRGHVDMPFETPRVQVEQMASIREALAARGLPGGPLVIPENFAMTAPPPSQMECQGQKSSKPPQSLLPNPQTDEFLAMLGLDHVVTVPCPGFQSRFRGGGGGGGSLHGEGSGGVDAEGSAAVQDDKYEIDLDAARDDPNEIQLD
ncbi:unnamed protein product [Ectocarpus sp. CCAP 1310/34]|nr:unnamed protein product [Ectocarpus sp. CCAP 1310/34]